jgi:hypothetical protein
MTASNLLAFGIDPALSLLPLRMTSPQARALLVAICVQESAIVARRQKGRGPARGYAQFEAIAVQDVLTRDTSRVHAAGVCRALDIEPQVEIVHRAIEFNDVLMAAFARLNLWNVPESLPGRLEVDRAWHYYEDTWRPGKPRPAKWPTAYAIGWQSVEEY